MTTTISSLREYYMRCLDAVTVASDPNKYGPDAADTLCNRHGVSKDEWREMILVGQNISREMFAKLDALSNAAVTFETRAITTRTLRQLARLNDEQRAEQMKEIDRLVAKTDPEIAEQMQFIAWLKANGIYNEFASAGAMRQMQTVWKAAMKERDTVRLKFTVNEQNCLAMVCQTMSSVHYKHNVSTDPVTSVDAVEWATQMYDIVESFPSTNWGELYDKFHRQGANS